MGDCQSVHQIAAELWNEYGEYIQQGVAMAGPYGAAAAAAMDIGEQMGKLWNSAAGNSPLKIGARYLVPGKLERGTVLVGAQRTFVGGPFDTPTTLVFNKVNGDAPGSVLVCTFAKSGQHEDLKHFKIPKRSGDLHFQVVLPAQRVFSAKIDSANALQKLQYTLRLELEA